MEKRILGRTKIEVGALGLGTEYLNGQDAQTCDAVIRRAVEHGVSYFDILFAFNEYREHMGQAFRGIRDKCVIAGHIGCAETKGQYRKSRNSAECEKLFHDLLKTLGTDYVDVLMVQFVDTLSDYNRVIGPGGLLELAVSLRDAGKAKSIGISVHGEENAIRAVESDQFDVLMFPRSVLSARIETRAVLDSCAQKGVGFVAMKPYGGGRLFRHVDSLEVPPGKLVRYPLLDPAVSCVVPGVKSIDELDAAIDGIENPIADDRFEEFAQSLFDAEHGSCVYCNHCLPCPEEINIGELIMLLDMAKSKGVDDFREGYAKLAHSASDCSECAACESRCPYDVPVIERMRDAVSLFA